MLLCFAVFGVARAQSELTVYEGTTTSNVIPAYVFYFDDFTRSQFVIPADDLTEMNNGTISALKFYTTSSYIPYTAVSSAQVYLMEVDYTTMTGLEPTANGQIVYEGYFDFVSEGEGGSLTIEFDTPYTYGGGNLLVGIENTEDNGYKNIAFYGTTVEAAAWGGSSGSGLEYVTGSQRNFIPQTTFTFVPGSGTICEKPESLELNGAANPTYVYLRWMGHNDAYNIEYKKASDEEWTVRLTNYQGLGLMLPNLTPNTDYQARVQGVCADGLSGWRTLSFSTPEACSTPSDLTATLTPGDATVATLAWTENGTATEWDIEYGTDAELENYQIANASGTPSYVLRNLTPETTYYARVKAYCGNEGYSSYSNIVSFQPTDKMVIGSGTSTNSYLPTYTYYNYSYTQQIYTAAELGEAGLIESIDFYSTATERTRNLDIYMVSTDKDSFESTSDWVSVTEADLMFSGEVTFAQNAWTTINLEGFVYDGVNNVVLVVDDNTGSYVSSPGFRVFSTENTQAIYVYSDGTNYDPFEPATANNTLASKNQVRLAKSDLTGCMKPTALTVNYTGGLTAEVSWTSDAQAWNMRVNGHRVPVTITNPFTLTRLQLATTYDVEVQAVCADGSTSEWASTSFTTDLCLPENMCELTFVLTDSYGDGWNGNAIVVTDVESGTVLATLANQNLDGTTGTETQTVALNVCDGRELQFSWTSGSYVGEVSYTVTDINGEVVVEGNGAGFETFNYIVSCVVTNCKRPTDLTVTEIGNHSAVLGWTENGEATEWVIEYTDLMAGAVYTMETTTNPYTLVGLFPESDYTVRVRPVCSDFDNKWSEIIRFTTDVACPAPTDLNAVRVMANKATLTWEGSGAEYNVRYAALNNVQESINFDDSSMGEWTTIDADGDGYDWILGTDILQGTGYGHNGSNDLVLSQSYINNVGALTPDNYLVSPQVTLGGTITFWACGQDASYVAEHFGVAVSTTGNTDPADFTTIWESTMTAKGRGNANCLSMNAPKMNRNTTRSGNRAQGTWYQYTIDLSDYSGQGYVAIRHFNCTDMFYLDVDDIVIDDGTQVTWTERPVRNNTVTLSGLEPETQYAWQVQAVCGGDDGSSEWTDLAHFTTGSFCDAPFELEATNVAYTTATLNWLGNQRKYNVRYCTAAHQAYYFFDDFNEYEGANWTQNDGAMYYWTGSTDYFALLGYNGTEETHYLISPELGGEYEEGSYLTFGYVQYPFVESDTAMVFRVGYSTTTADLEAFTWGDEITAGISWTAFEELIPAGTKYFAIQTTDAYEGVGLILDDFGVFGPYVEPGEWVVVENVTSPLNIDGLNPGTYYWWQVQGKYRGCNDNDETDWSEVQYFVTETLPTQTVALLRGANWFSTNLVITLDDLKNALVTALPNKKIAIAAQDGTSLTYNRGRWTGDLETLDVTKMYIIQVAANCEITLEGEALVPAEHPITLNQGWNWIGYPGSESMSIEEALTGFRARNNDVIKGRTSFTKFTNGEWQGTLTAFEPGQGYQFGSGSARPRILVFQTGVRGDVIIDDNTPNFFQPVNEYANNMTMTAVVELNGEELRSEDYELAAFVGDECRGSVKLMYVESIDRYVAFLTVLGDQEEGLRFQLTDGFDTNLSSNVFTYAVDDVTGTLDEPYVVRFSPMDVEENALANVKIYPNPSEGIFNIEGNNIKRVEVFNAFGQSVYSKESENDFMKIDLTNRATGVYLIRIITDNGIQSHQVVKR